MHNPLPIRVAVAITIDGLNVIDGKRTTSDKGEKWMINANLSLTLRGWQTDRSSDCDICCLEPYPVHLMSWMNKFRNEAFVPHPRHPVRDA